MNVELTNDLLDALKEAEKWITEFIESGDHSGSDDPEHWAIIVKIRAVLAKAKNGA